MSIERNRVDGCGCYFCEEVKLDFFYFMLVRLSYLMRLKCRVNLTKV